MKLALAIAGYLFSGCGREPVSNQSITQKEEDAAR
jgi:hypothetical protein